jgi:tetratricopeptide (TPR) repeat protein
MITICCGYCGIAEGDDIKLKDCDDDCGLVKYCSEECNELDRPEHDVECKKKKQEIREKDLFEQPDESHLGECPICCLPLPLDSSKSTLMRCCCKILCNGCAIANIKREFGAGLEHKCAFCREPLPDSGEEQDKRIMKRIKKNCPVAMREVGKERCDAGDYDTAFEYFTKAAELGNAAAHYSLSCMYGEAQGVEKDIKKAVHHWEEAAIGGHPTARHNLGCFEANNGRYETAKKHFLIAANHGLHDSLKVLMKLHTHGLASKEDYADALRAYQAAVDATKSKEREKAENPLRAKK